MTTDTIITTTLTSTPMTDAAALYRLLSWLSPGYPVGAYTYSHGLEQAVEAELVTHADAARAWISDTVAHGAGLSDAVFLAESFRATALRDERRLGDIKELAAAFVATRELALESQAQGAAFLEITANAWPTDALKLLADCRDGPCAYAVAVGCAAAGHRIPLESTLHGYLHAFAANLVSAAVRLVPLGQTDGQRITAALEGTIGETAKRALTTEPDAVSSTAMMVDICSMKHETQHTRLFRS